MTRVYCGWTVGNAAEEFSIVSPLLPANVAGTAPKPITRKQPTKGVKSGRPSRLEVVKRVVSLAPLTMEEVSLENFKKGK